MLTLVLAPLPSSLTHSPGLYLRRPMCMYASMQGCPHDRDSAGLGHSHGGCRSDLELKEVRRFKEAAHAMLQVSVLRTLCSI